MKKSTLALVVSALALASTANAAEVYNKDGNKLDFYGRVKAEHYFSDNASSDGDKSYVRIGFKGQTQINDLMTGYGQWEYQYNVNNSEGSDANAGNKTRLGFAGLKFGQYGSFDYGRNYGVLYDVEAWTDVFPEFGGDGTARTDNFMTARATGVATYRNSNFFGLVDGLRFALQYQGKNDSTSANARGSITDTSRQNGDGYGASLGYTIADTGISLMSAITSSDRTNQQQLQALGSGDKAESWGAGIKYDANSIYLASIYTETRNMTPIGTRGFANKAQNFEVVAQYQFDFGLRPSLGYIQTKGKDIEGIGDEDLVKYIDVGMTYYFNKNMSTFVDYKINQLDDNNKLNLNNDDVVAVGLTYQF
ncbi:MULTISPECIES: porin OmpC [Enterobacterales]|jgi:outer membrane pore protein E|uniref:Outer membrane porin PhoE n=2 Tax=Pantoea TaxID=53335 RepID=A0A1I4E3V5_9GAMM|nr:MULTISPECIES: porin OmpC [Enterobacterales]MRS18841.1 porin OmpC [Enterobacteriaceae bacterium RIT692]MRT26097.1 porin OmpC [Enterobacteriaceae bacterium RIT697]MRT40703.1 porin OmpC [Enterobacteriaceae bacterium RIT702]KAJ9434095.1 porin OmpC [Pantoea sp. YR343]MBB3305608.1 outer membrane pore protein E [Enterobacter sp. Sphag1F]